MTPPARRIIDKERILARLKQGPATMPELMVVCPGGYRQRISDLRAEGYVIDCIRTKAGSVFTFKGHKHAGQLSMWAA